MIGCAQTRGPTAIGGLADVHIDIGDDPPVN